MKLSKTTNQFKNIDDQETGGIGTSNDIEVAFDGDTVTGFVTTGLDFSQMPCPDSGSECKRVGGHISKFSADLESTVWNTRFNNFAGGVGKYASVTGKINRYTIFLYFRHRFGRSIDFDRMLGSNSSQRSVYSCLWARY